MGYKIKYMSRAETDLSQLSENDQRVIRYNIKFLADNAFEHLHTSPTDQWRGYYDFPVHNHRVIYRVDDQHQTLIVYAIEGLERDVLEPLPRQYEQKSSPSKQGLQGLLSTDNIIKIIVALLGIFGLTFGISIVITGNIPCIGCPPPTATAGAPTFTSPPPPFTPTPLAPTLTPTSHLDGTLTALAPTPTSPYWQTETAIAVTMTARAQPTNTFLSNACPPAGSPDAIFTQSLSVSGNNINVGSGVFSNVGRPNGNEPIEFEYARDAFDAYRCIQMINPGALLEPQSNRQCLVSRYNTNRIWAGSVMSGITLEVQKVNSGGFETIGQLDVAAPDTRQYMVDYELQVGDELCLVAPNGKTIQDIVDVGGYLFMIGRDMPKFANSWCLLLENNNAQHYCN